MWWIALILLPLVWVAIDLAAGFRARRHANTELTHGWNEDFSVLVPIYGDARYLANRAYLADYGDRVVLCTTSGETEAFYAEIESLAQNHGWRVYRSPYSPITESKKRRTGGVIRDRVIRDALLHLDGLGAYSICIDADTETSRPLQELAGALQESGADFASIDLVPQRDGGMLVQLQRHEYRQSMRMRFLLPWMLSGACHIGKTDTFRQIMARHSLFFQGNDVEAGLLGDQLGYRAVHLPFPVETEVPSRFKPWWRQRIAWAGGEFRLFITNFRYIIKHPFLWVYGGLIAIMMFGLRWMSLVDPSWILLGVAVLYYIGILWIHWRTRNWWLLLLPPYALLHSLVLTPIGILWYFVMAIPEKNFGVIRPNREVEVTA